MGKGLRLAGGAASEAVLCPVPCAQTRRLVTQGGVMHVPSSFYAGKSSYKGGSASELESALPKNSSLYMLELRFNDSKSNNYTIASGKVP